MAPSSFSRVALSALIVIVLVVSCSAKPKRKQVKRLGFTAFVLCDVKNSPLSSQNNFPAFFCTLFLRFSGAISVNLCAINVVIVYAMFYLDLQEQNLTKCYSRPGFDR